MERKRDEKNGKEVCVRTRALGCLVGGLVVICFAMYLVMGKGKS